MLIHLVFLAINIVPTRRKIIEYTIGRRFKKSPLEVTAIPGSLEQTLEEPENYLELRSDLNVYNKSNRLKKLNPIDIYSNSVKKEIGKSLKFKDDSIATNPLTGILKHKQSYRSNDSVTGKEPGKLKRRKKFADIGDQEIIEKYNQVGIRFKGPNR